MDNNIHFPTIHHQVLDVENLITDGKNKYPITCTRCTSKILNAGVAEFKDIEFYLPNMTISEHDTHAKCTRNLHQYWMVNDKFAFENVGFSNSVSGSGIKYLICADCEIGPIGWYDPDMQISYVALARIKHIM